MSKPAQKIEPDHSEVSFPPGSYDHEALQKGLDRAVDAKPENRAQLIDETLARENQTPIASPDVIDPAPVEELPVDPVPLDVQLAEGVDVAGEPVDQK